MASHSASIALVTGAFGAYVVGQESTAWTSCCITSLQGDNGLLTIPSSLAHGKIA